MTSMEIKTNNQPRLIRDWYEIPESIRESEFDYLDDSEAMGRDFIEYKGQWYDLHDVLMAPESLQAMGWHGLIPDSAFSGVAFKYCDDDPDRVIMATVLC